MKNRGLFLLYFCLSVVFALFTNTPKVFAAEETYSEEDIFEICEGIIDWASTEGGFFNENLIQTAGSSASDWLFIGYCRLFGESDENGTGEYLQALEKYISNLYESGTLTNTKATEWQRVGLAVLAAGADPTAFGIDADGNSIDLVADGAYDHEKYSSLGRQGVNGWCFALILMDAAKTEIPEDASYTREYIIEEILSAQLGNGGYSLTGAADPDVTSIAIQALSRYYEDETVYTFESDEETVSRTVGEAIDLALSWLSLAQLDEGDFSSYGSSNVESTAQVLLALSCLGIDPQTDERFIKGENTVIDGLLKYRTESGAFAHALDDEGNATAENGLSSAQTLCGLTAYYRMISGMSGFYEFTDDEVATDVTYTEEEAGSDEDESDEIEERIDTEENVDTEESIVTEEQTELTETQGTDDAETQDGEESETISTVSDEEEAYENLVYIIVVVVLCIGMVALIVMKKIGLEDDKDKSE